MKYTFYSLLVALCIIIFCKECVCKDKPIVVVDNTKRDTTLYNKIDSLKAKIESDSLFYETARNQDDSERNDWLDNKDHTEQLLRNQVVGLTFERNKFRTASEAKDTVGAMAACGKFIEQAEQFYTDGLKYKTAFDSLVANAAERRAIDSSERGLVYQGIRADGLMIDTLKSWHQSDVKTINDFANRLKKADKRWGVGPGVGVTYYNNSFQPSFSINIHYSFIKF